MKLSFNGKLDETSQMLHSIARVRLSRTPHLRQRFSTKTPLANADKAAEKAENVGKSTLKEQIITGLGTGAGMAGGLYLGSRPGEDVYTLINYAMFGALFGSLIGPSAIVVSPVCVAAVVYGQASGNKIFKV